MKRTAWSAKPKIFNIWGFFKQKKFANPCPEEKMMQDSGGMDQQKEVAISEDGRIECL